MARLADLSRELMLQVLRDLDHRSLLACASVCHSLHNLIRDSLELQYRLELSVSAYDDGSWSNLPISERYPLFLDYINAWRRLEWVSEEEVPMDPLGHQWDLSDGVLGQTKDEHTILLNQVPSCFRSIDAKQWEHRVNFKIRDFASDARQDLLVVVEQVDSRNYRVHMLQLSTGRPHPRAHAPEVAGSNLDHRLTFARRCSLSIQVCDDHVGVLFAENGTNELCVWDWTTGQQKLVLLGHQVAAFTFLDSRFILLGCITYPTLPSALVPHEASLVVVDLAKNASRRVSISDLEYECALLYPEMQAGVVVETMYIRAGPATSRDMEHWPCRVPFRCSHEDRLLVATLWTLDADEYLDRGPIQLFVLARTIMSYLFDTCHTGSSRRIIPWEDWGPGGTRMLIAPPTYLATWVCNVSGTKFATKRNPQVSRFGSRHILIYDFNQSVLRRALAREEHEYTDNAAEMESFCVIEPSTLSHRGIFKDDVVTCLPYRVTGKLAESKRSSSTAFTAAMLTEDAIVLVYSVRPLIIPRIS